MASLPPPPETDALDARLREQLQAALAQDRQWMAAEVHDSVAQSLAYVKMRLPLLHDAMLAHDDAASLRYYEDVRSTLAQAHTSLRQILADLRAPLHAESSLPGEAGAFVHALTELARGFEARTGIVLGLQLPPADLPLPALQHVQALRVVQEALANLARHAGASQAWLQVQHEGGRLRLHVIDDGRGPADLDRSDGGSHYGIDIMNGRARRLGGQLQITSRPGGGTCVTLEFPWTAPTRPPAQTPEP
jgi:two-component system nitrate/nitrite sensor histidine kinase NarX